jgi:hypothetical protein
MQLPIRSVLTALAIGLASCSQEQAGYTETNADKARAGRSSVENENRAAVDRAFWPGKTELPVEGKNSGRVPNGREYSWGGNHEFTPQALKELTYLLAIISLVVHFVLEIRLRSAAQ